MYDVPFRKKTNKRMNKMSSMNGYWEEKEQVEGATAPGKLITYLDALGECDNPVCQVMGVERALRNETHRIRLVLRGLRSSLTFIITTYLLVLGKYIVYRHCSPILFQTCSLYAKSAGKSKNYEKKTKTQQQ